MNQGKNQKREPKKRNQTKKKPPASIEGKMRVAGERFFAYAQNDRLKVRTQNDSLVVRQISERELSREINLITATESRGEPRKENKKRNKQRRTSQEEPKRNHPPVSRGR